MLKNKKLTFFETSAKAGTNIDELFDSMGHKLIAKSPKEEPDRETVNVVPSSRKKPEPNKEGCAC